MLPRLRIRNYHDQPTAVKCGYAEGRLTIGHLAEQPGRGPACEHIARTVPVIKTNSAPPIYRPRAIFGEVSTMDDANSASARIATNRSLQICF